ncbi:MAG: hypothetical protein HYW57_05725 [Ignavibacteriales bacterium]|nr:hypothetical protein [Ignavibacteriales bacterium]
MMNAMRRIGSFLYKRWMAFARLLAIVNTTVVLTLVYFLLIGPSWLIMRLLGKDLLDRRLGDTQSYWRMKDPLHHTMDECRRQF